jgi:hypothetical protein
LQRTRFGLWGESVGLISDPYGTQKGYDTNLDRPDIRPLVESTLNNIRLLLEKVDHVDDKYNIEPSISRNKKALNQGPHGLQVFKTTFERFKSQIKKSQKEASPWKVTQWVVHDETKLRGIIDRLREYVDGLESITFFLGLWADQRARLNDEIEHTSDVESLKLLRDANLGQLDSALPDISDTASRRLITVAESTLEQISLDSVSAMGQDDHSFVTAYSNSSGLRPTIDFLIPGSWPKSTPSAILEPRLASCNQPEDEDVSKKAKFDTPCKECLGANRDCERLPLSKQCIPCDHSNFVYQMTGSNDISTSSKDEDRQIHQSQNSLAEVMLNPQPHLSQMFEGGRSGDEKNLFGIKTESCDTYESNPNLASTSTPLSKVSAHLGLYQNDEYRRLLDITHELRKYNVDHALQLPQIVVCGTQSAGKSSVLEAISNIKFPRGATVCTRCVTE